MSQFQGYQFNRQVNVIVANATLGTAREISDLKIEFSVRASDVETPNTAEIRIYNLSQSTLSEILKEYTSVILQAGYDGRLSQLFVGTIKQFKYGKERNIDSYLDILAADSDEPYNFGFVNKSIKGPNFYTDRFNAIVQQLGTPKDPNSSAYLSSTGGVLPRGKVLFGLARNYLREIGRSTGTRWSFQNGFLTLIPLNGYLPSEPIDINSQTGMVGVPEVTDQGIMITTLLNPLIQIGQAVRLSSADIQQLIIRQQGYPNYSSINYAATVKPGLGTYRVMVAEHEGNTRENSPWFTYLTCLAIDPSTSASPVAAYSTQ